VARAGVAAGLLVRGKIERRDMLYYDILV